MNDINDLIYSAEAKPESFENLNRKYTITDNTNAEFKKTVSGIDLIIFAARCFQKMPQKFQNKNRKPEDLTYATRFLKLIGYNIAIAS